MRRCHSSALSIILGIAWRISVLLRLRVERQRSITDIWIAANRKPYYSTVVSAAVFQKLDFLLRRKMYCWAKRKHPNKGKRWIFTRYFKPAKERKRYDIKGKTRTLKQYSDTPIIRHRALRTGVSPYDGNWSYWAARRGKYPGVTTTQGGLLKHQQGRCSHCRLIFRMEDKIELHHRDGNRHNTTWENLTMVHLHCHDALHGTGTHDKSDIAEEPYAGKLCAMVRPE
jgi:RNA-directed DNA polymerase